MFKYFIMTFTVLFNCYATDVSSNYKNRYVNDSRLSTAYLDKLQKTVIVFVPGILSETFIHEDGRSKVDLSLITRDYYESSVKHLKRYGLAAKRIPVSSYNLNFTKGQIRREIEEARGLDKKVLFVSHSLGGLALLDFLIENEEEHESILGVAFMQSPFRGSPIASIYRNDPVPIDDILKGTLPFLNTSDEVIDELLVENRTRYMEENDEAIKSALGKIPSITFASRVNGAPSLFKVTADVIKNGCVTKFLGICFSPKIHRGELDDSDGMVPVNSSKLPGVDHIVIDDVDHGETVVHIPFRSIDQGRLAETLIKMVLDRASLN